MTVVSANAPFAWYPDLDGNGLNEGYVYCGVADLNAVTNPVAVFFDAAKTITAEQPLRTSGGFIVDGSGSPQNIYCATDFSMQVNDRNNALLYSVPSYQQRFLSETITFGAVIVGTSIDPDAAGGASNGALTTAWSNTVTQGLQAKTGTVYDTAQPTVADDLAALNQRKSVVMVGRQTSSAASPAATAVNIYNVASIVQNGTGIYDIVPTVAIPASVSVMLTNTVDVAEVDLVVFARSTTLIKVKTYVAGVLTPTPFDFVVFGNPAVADPIS